MHKVAIITRTKDRPQFLKRAIKSVSDQTYNEYVHVIVNDGGDSEEIDKLVDSQDDKIKQRIQVFHRPTSSGAPDTIFTESIDRVESEYVAIHDDDDTWHPDMLKYAVKELEDGRDGVVVRTENIFEEVNGSTVKQLKTSEYLPDVKSISLYRQCLDNQLTALSFVYKRKAYVSVGKYDNSLPVVGDWEFGLRFLMKYDVQYIDPGFALAYYHHRDAADRSFALHDQRQYMTYVLNKYLRKDLESGKLGVGYIMNDLRYEQDFFARTIRRLLPGPVAKLIRKKVR